MDNMDAEVWGILKCSSQLEVSQLVAIRMMSQELRTTAKGERDFMIIDDNLYTYYDLRIKLRFEQQWNQCEIANKA